jgi:hypothetical protein
LSSLVPSPIDDAARDVTTTNYDVRTFSFAFDLDQQSKGSQAVSWAARFPSSVLKMSWRTGGQ